MSKNFGNTAFVNTMTNHYLSIFHYHQGGDSSRRTNDSALRSNCIL